MFNSVCNIKSSKFLNRSGLVTGSKELKGSILLPACYDEVFIPPQCLD